MIDGLDLSGYLGLVVLHLLKYCQDLVLSARSGRHLDETKS